MIIDGYTVLFTLTLAVLVIITLAIFTQRQLFRLRDNNSRREANVVIGYGLSARHKKELNDAIDASRQFQLLRSPKFTDIGTIGAHVGAPYINRMIALDELREIDRQLEFCNAQLVRTGGESTYAFLTRIREIALPSLSEGVVTRIGVLAEHCRYRHQKFDESNLAELRVLIKECVRLVNNEQERLSALQLKSSNSSGSGSLLPSSLHDFAKRLSAESGRGASGSVKYREGELSSKKVHTGSTAASGSGNLARGSGKPSTRNSFGPVKKSSGSGSSGATGMFRRGYAEHELPLLGTHHHATVFQSNSRSKRPLPIAV